jgi:Adenovirus IVa2 protein
MEDEQSSPLDARYERREPFKFKLPALLVISGPTGAGKSWMAAEIVKHRNDLIEPIPEVVVWVYNIFQDELFEHIRETCPEVIFVQGIEKFYDTFQFMHDTPHLIILDDQMAGVGDNKQSLQFVTADIHHKQLFCIYLCQSMYYKSRFNALLMRQARYMILFQNKRNSYETNMIGRELGITTKHMKNLFKDASEHVTRPYLLFDCDPETKDKQRIMVKFFPWLPYKFFYYIPDEDGK